MSSKIHFIINPASGIQEPILSYINQAFAHSSIDWEVSVTKKPGDEITYAHQAAKTDASAIALYGGDGTITAGIKALYQQAKPIIILPGGTANVFASSLHIPRDVRVSLQAIATGSLETKKIDMALVNKQPLLLAITTGILAENVIATDVAEKNMMGELAYYLNTLKILPQIQPTTFAISIDQHSITLQAVALIIANSGQFSVGGFTLMAGQDNTDGKIDVLAIHAANPASLIDALRIKEETVSDTISFWKASSVTFHPPANTPILIDDVQITHPQTYEITVDQCAVELHVPHLTASNSSV